MLIKTTTQVRHRLEGFRPKKKWYRRFVNRSAVALILRQVDTGIEVLMIKRSEREGDRWSGHMAFPGGRTEQDDDHTLHTAHRETWEEIGLDMKQHTKFLGRLSDLRTHALRGRQRMVITPYVFSIDKVPELNINYEVAEVIWLPLNFLAAKENRQSMKWQLKMMSVNLPCYHYRERLIWGLSLSMLDELVDLLVSAHK
ncbi:CoA pyrophosphatase [Oceanicoccus sp. KOV_DT_Chl]|uniref:NUDIX hydrolase n=1 Tax=Oceanicoccus sp. KOV_DT_Chl TaxID=1904639 RepID=UPI000C7B856F|nr:CoA pyrophosphatase [Oceanicoccus sp. KOV_DT_Chl]